MLTLEARARLLKFLNRVDEFHVISDASTKGSSRKSRKTNMLQTAARGVKGDQSWDVMLHFGIIRSDSAVAECKSMEDALELKVGGKSSRKRQCFAVFQAPPITRPALQKA